MIALDMPSIACWRATSRPCDPAAAGHVGMDGYAVRAAMPRKYRARLKVIGEVAAGAVRAGDRPGEAARDFTGGVVLMAPTLSSSRRTPSRMRQYHHHGGRDRGPAYPSRRRRFSTGRRAAIGGRPPHRPRSLLARA